jgi:hypothetical protein
MFTASSRDQWHRAARGAPRNTGASRDERRSPADDTAPSRGRARYCASKTRRRGRAGARAPRAPSASGPMRRTRVAAAEGDAQPIQNARPWTPTIGRRTATGEQEVAEGPWQVLYAGSWNFERGRPTPARERPRREQGATANFRTRPPAAIGGASCRNAAVRTRSAGRLFTRGSHWTSGCPEAEQRSGQAMEQLG